LFYGGLYGNHVDIDDGQRRKHDRYYRLKNDNKLAGNIDIFHQNSHARRQFYFGESVFFKIFDLY